MNTRPRRNDETAAAEPTERRGLLQRVFNTLYGAIGPRHWWPGESPFEVIVGAVLTQNTAWKNVEQAIGNLKREDVLTALAVEALEQDKLAQLIRSSGYYNQKAAKLKRLVHFLVQEYDGDLQRMRQESTEVLRKKLLAINGIGPETADSILLYALEKPVFVVDTYTRRVCSRHSWVQPNASYEALRAFFEEALPRDVGLFNEFHALLVYVGHHFCRSKPRCSVCPLETYLEHAGPDTRLSSLAES